MIRVSSNSPATFCGGAANRKKVCAICERAVELDPRNFDILQQIAISYQGLGRYAESIAALDRALAIMPDNVETRAIRGLFYLCWKADTRPLHQTIDSILAQGPGAIAHRRGHLVLLRAGGTRSGCGRTSARRAGRQCLLGRRHDPV